MSDELRVEAKMVRDALVDICNSVFKDPVEGLIDENGNILFDNVIVVSEAFVADEDTTLVGVQQFRAGWDVSVIIGDEGGGLMKAEVIESTDKFLILSGVVAGLILAQRAVGIQKDWDQKIQLTIDAEVQKMEGKSQ